MPQFPRALAWHAVSFVHSFTRSLVHSFTRSLVHSFKELKRTGKVPRGLRRLGPVVDVKGKRRVEIAHFVFTSIDDITPTA